MLGDYLENTEKTYKYLQENQGSFEPHWRLALRINKWENNKRAPTKKEDDDFDEGEQPEANHDKDAQDSDAQEAAGQVAEGQAAESDIGKILLSSVHAEEQQMWEDEETALGFTDDQAYVLTTAGKTMVALTREILDQIKNSTSDTDANKAAHNVNTEIFQVFLRNNKVTLGKGKPVLV